MHRNIVAAFGTLLAGIACAQPQEHGISPFIAAYKSQAIQGDLSVVESELVERIGGIEDENYYRQFRARFVDRSHGLELDGLEDPLVEAAAGLFEDYWRDALLQPSDISDFETRLSTETILLLRKHDLDHQDLDPDNALDRLKSAIEDRGYFALFGRTRPLLEFMVWREMEVVHYQVELTDRTVPVTVHFLTDFISRGWLHFATFGDSGTGGWANDDGLFAVEGYDRQSEKFRVSYLKHEARHFADYPVFPKLRGVDLEYRAKLTELAFADGELSHLLKKFAAQAKRDSSTPHPRANWQVVNDLSAALLDGVWPDDPDVWRTLPAETIRHTAATLLDAHTKALKEAGAESTTGIISR